MIPSAGEYVIDLADSGRLDLPLPAGGQSAERLGTLSHIARSTSLSVARLAEAHTDAVAILHEAGHEPIRGALYGVWASQTSTEGVAYDARTDTISGTMGFASGGGIVTRALVTARSHDGTVLLDVGLEPDNVSSSASGDSVRHDLEAWSSPALTGAATGPVTFANHRTPAESVVGRDGWYLTRPGFWHGACAPAACWAGGALGLIDAAADLVDDNPHRRAHYGAMVAHEWTLAALLRSAGSEMDTAPDDALAAERRARSLRFAVANICRDTLDRFGRAFGPRPHVQSADIAQRSIDLDLYIRQHHAERELPALADVIG